MRIVFMGSPDFSVPALNALNAAGHEIVSVYCQPPRPAGRGQKDRRTPVHVRAVELGLPVRHPNRLRSLADQSAFAELEAEIAVVVAYGLLLPQKILDSPRFGCINIHASLLPRWRGAAPIHRAIMAGDSETGISIMQMDAGLDTGPVLLRATTPIKISDTTGDLHDRLSVLGASLITEALDGLDKLAPESQRNQGITYARKIGRAETRIDWTRSARFIDRQIRGLSPSPGAWTTVRGERIRLLSGFPTDGQGEAGTVLDGNLAVACGTGAIRITRLQRVGRKAMGAAEALVGWKVAPGEIFGSSGIWRASRDPQRTGPQINTSRQEALALLRTALNDQSTLFRDGQWAAIDAVVNQRKRMLVVKRAGWGKSSIYFIATYILRKRGQGPTLLVSHKPALTRNQIAAADRLGIKTLTVNSTNRKEWPKLMNELRSNKADMLLISPERLANDEFAESVLLPIAGSVGLVVVDQAHCISDWNHDFRSDYRLVVNVLQRMPDNIPILGITDSANDRGVAEIQARIGNMEVLRGSLM